MFFMVYCNIGFLGIIAEAGMLKAGALLECDIPLTLSITGSLASCVKSAFTYFVLSRVVGVVLRMIRREKYY